MEVGGWEGCVKAERNTDLSSILLQSRVQGPGLAGVVDVEMGTYKRSLLTASSFPVMPEAWV